MLQSAADWLRYSPSIPLEIVSSEKVLGRRSFILQNNNCSKILMEIYAKTIKLFALDFYALLGLRPHQLSRDRNLEVIIYQDSYLRLTIRKKLASCTC